LDEPPRRDSESKFKAMNDNPIQEKANNVTSMAARQEIPKRWCKHIKNFRRKPALLDMRAIE
jgi:hypothetical protein